MNLQAKTKRNTQMIVGTIVFVIFLFVIPVYGANAATPSAPTLLGSNKIGSLTSHTSITASSITPTSGSLIIITVWGEDDTGGGAPSNPVVSGDISVDGVWEEHLDARQWNGSLNEFMFVLSGIYDSGTGDLTVSWTDASRGTVIKVYEIETGYNTSLPIGNTKYEAIDSPTATEETMTLDDAIIDDSLLWGFARTKGFDGDSKITKGANFTNASAEDSVTTNTPVRGLNEYRINSPDADIVFDFTDDTDARAIFGFEVFPSSANVSFETINFVRSTGSDAPATGFSFDIGSADTNRLVVVTVDDESSGTSLTDVTVDGKSCNEVTEANNTNGAGNHQEMWYCDEDDLGSSSGSVTIQISGGDDDWGANAHLYTGVDQSGPYDFQIDETTNNQAEITPAVVDIPENGLLVFGAAHGSTGGFADNDWDTNPTTVTDDGQSPEIEMTEVQDAELPLSAVMGSAYYISTSAAMANRQLRANRASTSDLRNTGIVASWKPAFTVSSEVPGVAVRFASADPQYSNWYSASYTSRKAIEINPDHVDATLTDFPVLIDITDSDLAADALSDASDVVFTSSNGTTTLSHEIDSYNSGTGALTAWVKVPSLSSTATTTLYMYYDGPPGGENVQDVWSNDYTGVWHLSEDPSGTAPQIKDSTINKNDGTSNGSMTSGDQVSGQIDGSLDFEGTDDYVATGYQGVLGTNPRTVSLWFKTTSSDPNDTVLLFWGEDGSAAQGEGWRMRVENGEIWLRVWQGASSWGSAGAYNDGEWHQLVMKSPSSATLADIETFVDGVSLGLGSGTVSINTTDDNPVHIGAEIFDTVVDDFFDGSIDDVSLSSVERSDGWITTAYNNQSATSTFFLVKSEESRSTKAIVRLRTVYLVRGN